MLSGKEHIFVMNSVARLPGNFDNQWSYYSALTAGTDAVIKIPIQRGDVEPYYTTDTDRLPQQTECDTSSNLSGTEPPSFHIK